MRLSRFTLSIIAASGAILSGRTSRADSPLYEIVRSQIDLDQELAKHGIRVESCQFVHSVNEKAWPFPDRVGTEVRNSKRLGSCLFDNAFENLSAAKNSGHVRAQIRLKGDKDGDPATLFFLSWKPTQVLTPPANGLERIPLSIWSLGWAARNLKQAARATQHFFDHEILFRPQRPIPAGKLMGNEFIASLKPNGKPVLVEKIVFRMVTLTPEEIKAALKKGVREPKAKGVFLAFEPGQTEPSFAQEFLLHDLHVRPELNLAAGPWKLIHLRTKFRVNAQTPDADAPEELHLADRSRP